MIGNRTRYLYNGLVFFHRNKCTSYFVSSSFRLATKIPNLTTRNKHKKRIKSFNQKSQILCSQKNMSFDINWFDSQTKRR